MNMKPNNIFRQLKTFLVLFHILIALLVSPACASKGDDDNELIKSFLKIAEVGDINQQLSQLDVLFKSATERQKYYILPTLAKVAIEAEAYDQAELHANRLLEYADKFCCDWNTGNAIHDGNTVSGMVAVKRGDIQTALNSLLESGLAPESPQIATFGPDLMLARELLKHGETTQVIIYLNSIRRIWTKGSGRIDKWIFLINDGERPVLDKW